MYRIHKGTSLKLEPYHIICNDHDDVRLLLDSASQLKKHKDTCKLDEPHVAYYHQNTKWLKRTRKIIVGNLHLHAAANLPQPVSKLWSPWKLLYISSKWGIQFYYRSCLNYVTGNRRLRSKNSTNTNNLVPPDLGSAMETPSVAAFQA